jgi:hypothetical protein
MRKEIRIFISGWLTGRAPENPARFCPDDFARRGGERQVETRNTRNTRTSSAWGIETGLLTDQQDGNSDGINRMTRIYESSTTAACVARAPLLASEGGGTTIATASRRIRASRDHNNGRDSSPTADR